MIKKNIFNYDTDKYASLTDAVTRAREARAIKNDYEKNKRIIEDIVRPSPPTSDSMSVADRVVLAGRRRRGEVPCEGQLTDLSPDVND
jgi:hypothetical protein